MYFEKMRMRDLVCGGEAAWIRDAGSAGGEAYVITRCSTQVGCFALVQKPGPNRSS